MRKFLLCLFVFSSSFSFAEETVDPHSLFGIWHGEGSDEIVCYKQKHRNFFFITFGLVLVLGFVVWNRYRIKKRSEKELQLKNAIIEEKNKNITDSIRYAQHLQQSLMASEKQIQKTLERLKKRR